jgi:hypothetical protein
MLKLMIAVILIKVKVTPVLFIGGGRATGTNLTLSIDKRTSLTLSGSRGVDRALSSTSRSRVVESGGGNDSNKKRGGRRAWETGAETSDRKATLTGERGDLTGSLGTLTGGRGSKTGDRSGLTGSLGDLTGTGTGGRSRSSGTGSTKMTTGPDCRVQGCAQARICNPPGLMAGVVGVTVAA